jgi:ABC-2 type transport system permease protein
MRFPSLRGFWKLTWVETKVFSREPGGFIVTIVMPALMFLILGKTFGAGTRAQPQDAEISFNAAIFAAIVIANNAVQSLLQIISIYREGGILKRLRATPLSPVTILGAHVTVKLGFALVSLGLLMIVGRRLFPGVSDVNAVSFTLAVLLSTLSILSLGFVLASVVPTSRFAQMIGAVVLYPMLGVSGLFYPLELMPGWVQAIAALMPTTHAVALMQGVWDGSGWGAHWINVLGLVALFAFFTTLSTRVFRWE